MSQLSLAKKRMFMRSQEIEEEEEEHQIAIFTKSKTALTNINIKTNNLERIELQKINVIPLQINDDNKSDARNSSFKKSMSPQFAKTDRFTQKKVFKDNFDSRSQRPKQLDLFNTGTKKARRGTSYMRNQPYNPTISDISFTEQDFSVKNQSPIKQIRQTVHTQKLNLIIAPQIPRQTYQAIKPRECVKQYSDKLLKQQKSKNEKFTDSMFPPRFGIIYNKKYMYLDEGLKFERVTKIYEKQKITLIKHCQPTYLTAGKFSSTAVYSALSILAQQPMLVLSLFGQQQINQNGIYYVNLCKDGVWRYIIIDDFLPIKVNLKRTLMYLSSFVQNNSCQIWPGFIEKALAKMYGTYQDLYLTSHRGIKQIFTNLTGFPVSQFQINKDFRAFLVIIDAAIKRKHIVILQNIRDQYEQIYSLKKINIDYSYRILSITKNHINLRNLSNTDLTTKLTFQQSMMFSSLLIFRSEKNYKRLSYTLKHNKNYYSLLKFKITKPTRCYWTVYQNSEVYYKEHIGSKVQYRNSSSTMLLLKQTSEDSSDKTQRIEDRFSNGNMIESGKQIELKQGEHQIMIHLCQPENLNFTVVYYGENQINQINRIKCNEKWKYQCNCNS